MVSDTAQLFTIEGIAAAIIMIVTAYLVISTSTVFTQQDTHITNMQLEQLGHDALVIMDTPPSSQTYSDLKSTITNNNPEGFADIYRSKINKRTDSVNEDTFDNDNLFFNVKLFYRDPGDNSIKSIDFYTSDTPYRENSVKVTRLLNIGDDGPDPLKNKVVLVEVLLWRK